MERINRIIGLLLLISMLSSCSSREELASTTVNIGKVPTTIKLYSESFMNGDGLVERVITLSSLNKEEAEFHLHTAHYSDIVLLKKLEIRDKAYLMAEDKTGCSILDLNSNRKVYQSDVAENIIIDNPDGTAKDYMTHEAFTMNQLAEVLNVRPREIKMAEIDW